MIAATASFQHGKMAGTQPAGVNTGTSAGIRTQPNGRCQRTPRHHALPTAAFFRTRVRLLNAVSAGIGDIGCKGGVV
jgi:hypothetical protein